MKILIVEDDFTSRILLQKFLSQFGECHIAVSGEEALEAFRRATILRDPYDLICMDIIMRGMDGKETVRIIRTIEESMGLLPPRGVKIIMTTAMTGLRDVMDSFDNLCDAYLFKPVDTGKLLGHLKELHLLN